MSYQCKKLEEFERNYQEALATIERYRTAGDDMSVLVEWLLNTEVNPYGFLSDAWAGNFSSAQGFASFLSCLHHALYDDGDVTFVKVNGQPRIVFIWEQEEDFRDLVLTEQEKKIEVMSNRTMEVHVMDCSPEQFGVLYDEYNINSLKKCFSVDAGRLGIDFAVKHYSEYDCFDKSWIDTCSYEIEKWRGFYNKARRSHKVNKS